ncbi:hypothetical protein ACOACO_17615 [Nocardioides sp. CPCC 205120]|uniref:hypothetical protein n=1 Tax=Nocardioides sp. CPCC 205120 TaxID=3406462 RepID=UPI003B501B8F
MTRRARPGRTRVSALIDTALCALFGHEDIHVPGRQSECVHCGRLDGHTRKRR